MFGDDVEICILLSLRETVHSPNQCGLMKPPNIWQSHIHVICVRVLPIYIFTYVVYYVYIYTHLFICLDSPASFWYVICTGHEALAEDHQRWMEHTAPR